MKNFAAILFFAQGVPMMMAGDPFARTQKGNNNAYCQDNEVSWVEWSLKETNAELLRFFKSMMKFRRENAIVRQEQFNRLTTHWHGTRLGQPDWSAQSHTLGLHLYDPVGSLKGFRDLYFFSNAHWEAHEIEIPQLAGRKWMRIVDTARPAPDDIHENGVGIPAADQKRYTVSPRSTLILGAR